jgi:hypothetical protein
VGGGLVLDGVEPVEVPGPLVERPGGGVFERGGHPSKLQPGDFACAGAVAVALPVVPRAFMLPFWPPKGPHQCDFTTERAT